MKHILLLASLCALVSCASVSTTPVEAGMGPTPSIPPPNSSLITTVHIAPATQWAAGKTPHAAEGLRVSQFATGLDHPRWIYVLPNGDVLVAETNAPPKPDDARGIKGWVMKKVMARAGAGVSSANRITLLRDKDGDGRNIERSEFISGLNSPFGMALVGSDFYVADTDAVLRFPYTVGETHIRARGEKVVDLPAGTINHHWTKNIIANPAGTKLYVTVGSNSNVGENGLAAEADRAAIWEIDIASEQHRVFASGLRNPNGMAWEPSSGNLWTAVNERDELGNDLVPDYMTSVHENAFYGWPYSYYGAHVDDRVKPQDPQLVAKAIAPDYALGAHTASLGLASSAGTSLPKNFADGMFVGQHGSWNRKPFSGYKVIFVPFENGKPSGAAIDVLTGFLDADGNASGRPVGVALSKTGALLVADDVGNTLWRVDSEARKTFEAR